MPGFVLEEPFPLARFHNTVGAQDSKHFVVGLNALESTLNNDAVSSDDADFVAITVQGEGFKIYNVRETHKENIIQKENQTLMPYSLSNRLPTKNVQSLGQHLLVLPL